MPFGLAKALDYVDRELWEDLRDEQVKANMSISAEGPPDFPAWMTLTPDQGFLDWKDLLNEYYFKNEYDTDNWNATTKLIQVASKTPHGLLDCNKIIYHLMKDNSEKPRGHQGKWMCAALDESSKAFMTPEDWKRTLWRVQEPEGLRRQGLWERALERTSSKSQSSRSQSLG